MVISEAVFGGFRRVSILYVSTLRTKLLRSIIGFFIILISTVDIEVYLSNVKKIYLWIDLVASTKPYLTKPT